METTPLNLGYQIASATMNLVQDQQKAQGAAAIALIEGAAVQPATAASSPSPSDSIGVSIDIKV